MGWWGGGDLEVIESLMGLSDGVDLGSRRSRDGGNQSMGSEVW